MKSRGDDTFTFDPYSGKEMTFESYRLKLSDNSFIHLCDETIRARMFDMIYSSLRGITNEDEIADLYSMVMFYHDRFKIKSVTSTGDVNEYLEKMLLWFNELYDEERTTFNEKIYPKKVDKWDAIVYRDRATKKAKASIQDSGVVHKEGSEDLYTLKIIN
jgi:hypothetical protein